MSEAAGYGAVAFDLGVALFHLLFWRLFGWPARLEASGRVNAAITQTLNVMLSYVFLAYAAALGWGLAGGQPAPLLVAAGALFWLLRAGVQPLLFRINRRVNAGLVALWLGGAGLHALAIPPGAIG